MFVRSTNVCVVDRLPGDEECSPAANKEIVSQYKLYIGESELSTVFGETVGAFGQMVGVGRDHTVPAADTFKGTRCTYGNSRYVET